MFPSSKVVSSQDFLMASTCCYIRYRLGLGCMIVRREVNLVGFSLMKWGSCFVFLHVVLSLAKSVRQYTALIDTLARAGLRAVGRRGENQDQLLIMVTCPRGVLTKLVPLQTVSVYVLQGGYVVTCVLQILRFPLRTPDVETSICGHRPRCYSSRQPTGYVSCMLILPKMEVSELYEVQRMRPCSVRYGTLRS